MKILNLTQHDATPEQIADGVVEPSELSKKGIQRLLTFTTLPTVDEVWERACALVYAAEMEGAEAAMIGGAPYLMAPLDQALRERGILPVYSFSERVSVETVASDGTVTKTSKFKHIGFVR